MPPPTALSQEGVLVALKQHGVQFQLFEHAAVMTADAQAQALQGAAPDGVVTKNLFLRDKNRRHYLITALPDTKIDLKVLSSRLGCGKGGLSWGSQEQLAEALQVEPGCVTPLALANPSSKHVLLLVDAKLRAAGAKPFYVHPIVNTASVLLDHAGLDAFITGVGRQPVYVDLEAVPKIDRDNPPDLKQYADSVEPAPAAAAATEQPPQGGSGAAAAAASGSSSGAPAAAASGSSSGAPAAGKGGKKAAAKGKQAQQQQPSNDEHHIRLTNVVQRTEHLIDMVTQALLGKPAAEAGADAYVLRRLKADLQMELNAFKNAAFTSGYNAGKGEVVAFATRQYA